MSNSSTVGSSIHEAIPDETKKVFDLTYNFAENVLNWNKKRLFSLSGCLLNVRHCQPAIAFVQPELRHRACEVLLPSFR